MKLADRVPAVWLMVCMACAALSGCATLPAVPHEAPVRIDSADSPLADWLNRAPRHHSVQGVAKVRVQTSERTVSGTQVILAEAPDRLRTETLSPFGTPLLLLAADGAELRVLLPGENLFYRGRPTPENLGRFTRLPLRLPELVGILLSRPPLIDYEETQAWMLPGGGWRVELKAGPRRQLLGFDADRRLTEVRYLLRDELLMRLAYGGFRQTQPGLPWQTALELPLQQIEVSLNYSELAIDREAPPGVFAMQPPEGATVVPLDELPAPVDQAGSAGGAGENQGVLEGDTGK